MTIEQRTIRLQNIVSFIGLFLQKRPIIVRSLLIVATPDSGFHGTREFHELTDPYDRYYFVLQKKCVHTKMIMKINDNRAAHCSFAWEFNELGCAHSSRAPLAAFRGNSLSEAR